MPIHGTLALIAFLSQNLPPLSFLGFRAGMPVAQATAMIESVRGALTCRRSSDPRIRECTGFLPERPAGPQWSGRRECRSLGRAPANIIHLPLRGQCRHGE